MRGVWTTLRLTFTALPLQRVMLLVGSLSAVVGLGAILTGARSGASVWVPAVLAGCCILGLSMVPLIGGVLFRDLSAPRAVQMIPHGRLQLLLGSLLAELLAAGIVALFFVTISTHDPYNRQHLTAIGFAPSMLFGAVFVGVFAAITLNFIALYYMSRFPLGGLAFIPVIAVAQLTARAFPQPHFHDFFTSATDLSLTLAAAFGLWSLFGALYLCAGRIAPQAWGRVAVTAAGGTAARWLAPKESGASEPGAQRDAMHVLLTGSSPGVWSGLARPVLGVTGGSLAAYVLVAAGARHGSLEGFVRFLAVMIAYSGALVSGMGIFPMIGRARYLWLKTGLDRRQLFREAEAQSWRMFAILWLAAGSATTIICFLAEVSPLVIGVTLALSGVCGAGMIYLVLMHTRGWRIADILLATVLSATWFIGLLVSVAGSRAPLLYLLAVQTPLIPVLRAWAVARWTRIDWMINRPLLAQPFRG